MKLKGFVRKPPGSREGPWLMPRGAKGAWGGVGGVGADLLCVWLRWLCLWRLNGAREGGRRWGCGRASVSRQSRREDPLSRGQRPARRRAPLAAPRPLRRAARPRLPGNGVVVLSRLRAAVLPGGPPGPRHRER